MHNQALQDTENKLAKDISWIQGFLEKYFSQMPVPVRVITYLLILFLFGYAFMAAITMDVVYELKIDKMKADSQQPDIYLIDLDFTQSFLVDTDRTYKLSVPFTKALSIKWNEGYKASIFVKVLKGATYNGNWDKEIILKSDGIKNKFKPIMISYITNNQGDITPQIMAYASDKLPLKKELSILSTANAEENDQLNKKSDGARIYVEKIEVPRSYDHYDVNLSALINKNYLSPLVSRESRSSTFSLSVTPGKAKYYYGRYYFDLPAENLYKLKFIVELPNKLPFLKNTSYKHVAIPDGLSSDEPFEVSFENKVRLTLRYMNPYEIVYFKNNNNESDLINSLKTVSQKEGFYLFDVPSTRGKTSNAIFASNKIPTSIIKKVIEFTKNSNIALNSIQCTSNLSTTAKNQIQIGFSQKYTSRKTDSEINKFLNESDDSKFRKLCDIP